MVLFRTSNICTMCLLLAIAFRTVNGDDTDEIHKASDEEMKTSDTKAVDSNDSNSKGLDTSDKDYKNRPSDEIQKNVSIDTSHTGDKIHSKIPESLEFKSKVKKNVSKDTYDTRDQIHNQHPDSLQFRISDEVKKNISINNYDTGDKISDRVQKNVSIDTYDTGDKIHSKHPDTLQFGMKLINSTRHDSNGSRSDAEKHDDVGDESKEVIDISQFKLPNETSSSESLHTNLVNEVNASTSTEMHEEEVVNNRTTYLDNITEETAFHISNYAGAVNYVQSSSQSGKFPLRRLTGNLNKGKFILGDKNGWIIDARNNRTIKRQINTNVPLSNENTHTSTIPKIITPQHHAIQKFRFPLQPHIAKTSNSNNFISSKVLENHATSNINRRLASEIPIEGANLFDNYAIDNLVLNETYEREIEEDLESYLHLLNTVGINGETSLNIENLGHRQLIPVSTAESNKFLHVGEILEKLPTTFETTFQISPHLPSLQSDNKQIDSFSLSTQIPSTSSNPNALFNAPSLLTSSQQNTIPPISSLPLSPHPNSPHNNFNSVSAQSKPSTASFPQEHLLLSGIPLQQTLSFPSTATPLSSPSSATSTDNIFTFISTSTSDQTEPLPLPFPTAHSTASNDHLKMHIASSLGIVSNLSPPKRTFSSSFTSLAPDVTGQENDSKEIEPEGAHIQEDDVHFDHFDDFDKDDDDDDEDDNDHNDYDTDNPDNEIEDLALFIVNPVTSDTSATQVTSPSMVSSSVHQQNLIQENVVSTKALTIVNPSPEPLKQISQYLPPQTPYETPKQGSHMPYQFSYEVYNRENHYGHEERRDGSRVTGQYHVILPDGRRQVVTYYADETGYHPTVTYEKVNDFDPRSLHLSSTSPPSVVLSRHSRNSAHSHPAGSDIVYQRRNSPKQLSIINQRTLQQHEEGQNETSKISSKEVYQRTLQPQKDVRGKSSTISSKEVYQKALQPKEVVRGKSSENSSKDKNLREYLKAHRPFESSTSHIQTLNSNPASSEDILHKRNSPKQLSQYVQRILQPQEDGKVKTSKSPSKDKTLRDNWKTHRPFQSSTSSPIQTPTSSRIVHDIHTPSRRTESFFKKDKSRISKNNPKHSKKTTTRIRIPGLSNHSKIKQESTASTQSPKVSKR